MSRSPRDRRATDSHAPIPTNAGNSGKLFDLAGPTAQGLLVGAAWFEGYDNPRSKAFVAAYRKRYGVAPDIYVEQAYDTAYLLAEAIRQADSRLIRDKRAATDDFDGVPGHFGWTAERDISVRPQVLVVSGQDLSRRLQADAMRPTDPSYLTETAAQLASATNDGQLRRP